MFSGLPSPVPPTPNCDLHSSPRTGEPGPVREREREREIKGGSTSNRPAVTDLEPLTPQRVAFSKGRSDDYLSVHGIECRERGGCNVASHHRSGQDWLAGPPPECDVPLRSFHRFLPHVRVGLSCSCTHNSRHLHNYDRFLFPFQLFFSLKKKSVELLLWGLRVIQEKPVVYHIFHSSKHDEL